MITLAGKVALISGGARGLGAAECALFADLGAKVMLGDVRADEARATAARIGEERCRFTPLDVTDPVSWREAVERTVTRFGRLDILVNNAGIFLGSPIEETTLDEYMRVVMINQVGTFLGMQAVVPAMRAAGGGSIVNVASVAGVLASPGPTLAYTATKFAVRGMTRAAAIELAPANIRVNVLVPGTFDTPMNSENAAVMRAVTATAARQPISRLGRADEIAPMAAFLASDAASYCTGADYMVDGGMLAGHLRSDESFSPDDSAG